MINLLPPEYKEEIEYGRKNHRTLSWATTVAFGILSLLIITFVGKITIQSAKSQAESQKTALEQQMQQVSLSDVEKKYTSFIDTTGSVKKIYSQEVLYSRLIRKLATLLPQDAKLTNISLTDKDRALNLNFNNSSDGLGPVILVNLQNQGEQIAKRSQDLITGEVFALPFGYTYGDGQSPTPKVTIDSKTKQIEYFISVDDSKAEQDSLSSLKNALKSGGELSYELVKRSIHEKLLDRDDTTSSTPRFTGYSIDTSNRSVDFSFSANSINDVSNIVGIFSDSPSAAFIETYVFENKDYMFNDHCTNKSKKDTCEAVCKSSAPSCDDDLKVCKPLIEKGCKYTIRGYYDELYSSATIAETSPKEKNSCRSTTGLACTQKVTAKYNQLFDKVDINKASACNTDATGVKKCPVDIRAQFSSSAEFYFINSGAKL